MVVTDVHDILHWISKDNILGGIPTNPESDGLYNNWETAVQNWWAANSSRYPAVTLSQKPTFDDNVHTPINAPHITITSPKITDILPINTSVAVKVDTSGTYPLQKIDVFLNNVYVGTAHGLTPTISFTPADIKDVVQGPNTLMIVGTDWIYNTASVSEIVNVQ